MRSTITRASAIVCSAGVLSACGGGGGGSASPTPPLSDGSPAGNPACIGDYYRTATGTFRGTVEFDGSEASADGGSVCSWEVELTIRERDFGTPFCELDARLVSTVEQSVVLPATSDEASECQGEDTVLLMIDSMRVQSAPQLGVDYTLPIRLDFANPSGPPTRGPYFGDDSVVVPYLRPLAGALPLVDTLAIDSDGVVLENSGSSITSGRVSGRLKRVSE